MKTSSRIINASETMRVKIRQEGSIPKDPEPEKIHGNKNKEII